MVDPKNLCGGHSVRETPGPIPNPEAKPHSGEGTAPERVWETSTPPQTKQQNKKWAPELKATTAKRTGAHF